QVSEGEITGPFLEAYGLGEGREVTAEAEDAVSAALAEVQPFAESHGGAIELERIEDGVVTVRMTGTCNGCPSSAATLKWGVERAMRDHWPNFRRLEVADPAPPTDAAKRDLTCNIPGIEAPAPPPPPEPAPVLVQLRRKEK
ncbi:MAG: NifU family protein, partial [Acidimicrobiales bacterium]